MIGWSELRPWPIENDDPNIGATSIDMSKNTQDRKRFDLT
jgi:hypothetical protein